MINSIQPDNHEMRNFLINRKNEIDKEMQSIESEVNSYQFRLQQISKELTNIMGLLEVWDENENIVPNNRHVDSSSNTTYERVSTINSSSNFNDEIRIILEEDGNAMHISEICNRLYEKAIPLPGKGTQANVIVRIRRDPNQFTRTDNGTYALAEWGMPPMRTKSKNKRNRRKTR